MLNQDQLAILNDIFHSVIKPSLEENEEKLELFMGKVEEHEKYIQMIQRTEKCLLDSISTQMVTQSSLKTDVLKSIHITTLKTKHQLVDLNIENQNLNIVSSFVQDIITTRISIQKLNTNTSEREVSEKNALAA